MNGRAPDLLPDPPEDEQRSPEAAADELRDRALRAEHLARRARRIVPRLPEEDRADAREIAVELAEIADTLNEALRDAPPAPIPPAPIPPAPIPPAPIPPAPIPPAPIPPAPTSRSEPTGPLVEDHGA